MEKLVNRRSFLKSTTAFLSLMSIYGLFPNTLFGQTNKNKEVKMNYVTLSNGLKMPQLGYGTWQVSGNNGKLAILEALKVGYRLIDTATMYNNEEIVGRAVKESGVSRKDIFITTKMSGENNPDTAFDNNLTRLQMDYIDLYLLHWPRSNDLERWRVLEEKYKQKKALSIGVSNFNVRQLNHLISNSDIIPMVNQIEVHPFYADYDTIEFCEKNNIVINAYTPLGNIKRAMENSLLQELAKKYNKSVAQIMLRWSIQKGFIPIPKSSNPARIAENINVFDFEISSSDMNKLSSLNGPGGRA